MNGLTEQLICKKLYFKADEIVYGAVQEKSSEPGNRQTVGYEITGGIDEI